VASKQHNAALIDRRQSLGDSDKQHFYGLSPWWCLLLKEGTLQTNIPEIKRKRHTYPLEERLRGFCWVLLCNTSCSLVMLLWTLVSCLRRPSIAILCLGTSQLELLISSCQFHLDFILLLLLLKMSEIPTEPWWERSSVQKIMFFSSFLRWKVNKWITLCQKVHCDSLPQADHISL
jgi:hypothetical protein